MSFESVFQWLEDSALGIFMRENGMAFPLVEAIHVLALALVVGSIAMVDLRLLGISARNHSVSKLASEVLPITWVCFVVAVITGSLMLASNAVSYTHNFYFLGKMVLLFLAGVNMAIFHLFAWKSVANWDVNTPAPFAAKLAATLSLTFWVAVIVFGRWIGFTIGGHFG